MAHGALKYLSHLPTFEENNLFCQVENSPFFSSSKLIKFKFAQPALHGQFKLLNVVLSLINTSSLNLIVKSHPHDSKHCSQCLSAG